MQELEKTLLHRIEQFRRIAALPDAIKEINTAVKDAAPAMKTYTDSVKGLGDAIEKSFADTHEGAEELYEDEEEFLDEPLTEEGVPVMMDTEISDAEHEAARSALLEELLALSFKAADEGNIKLAYKIERTIDELREEG